VVVDFATKRALPGRLVVINGHQTTTDDHGTFVLDGVAPIYDAVVIEPDASTATVYEQLGRHNPVLPHTSSILSGSTTYAGWVAGTLSGGSAYPLHSGDRVDTYFFSALANGSLILAGGVPSSDGPAYRLGVQWNGPSSLPGHLMALGTFDSSRDAGLTDAGASALAPEFSYYSEDFTMIGGGNGTANVNLETARTAHLVGRIDSPVQYPATEILTYYRLNFPNSLISVAGAGNTPVSFDFTVPDLTASGATLCARAIRSTTVAGPSLETEECDLPFGTLSEPLTIQTPPNLLTPNTGTTVAAGSAFTWTPFPGGVYVLTLQAPSGATAYPYIRIVTSSTTANWPDLSAFGIAFPTGASYSVTISGVGPFREMDDAVSPNGLGAVFRAETRWSTSNAVRVTTAGL